MSRPEIIVFDVNETLLDLSSLRQPFAQLFGSAEPLGEWFARLLHASVVSNHLDQYRPFGALGAEALHLLARKRGMALTVEQVDSVIGKMLRLPAHPDVAPGIQSIRSKGYRTAILTNSGDDAAAAQMANSGLSGLIDIQVTVDIVGKFKPAAEVYEAAAERFGVAPGEAMLVAAHDWDIAGAAAVGYRSAFVTRPGVTWNLPGDPPDLVGKDIQAIAEALPT